MEKYRFSEEKLAMLESLPQPLAVYQHIDNKVVTIALSDGFCDLFGYADHETAYRDMNAGLFKFTHPDDIARLTNAAVKFLSENNNFNIVYRSKLRDRSAFTIVHATGKHIVTNDGIGLYYVWYIDEGDYLEESEDEQSVFKRSLYESLHEENILDASQYDHLTGLPNMTRFFQLAEEGKNAMKLMGSHAILLYFDLNGMKFYNSTYSYAEGDKLLKELGILLTQTFGSNHCCHINADRFAIYTKEDGIERILRNLFEECKKINNRNSLPVRVGIYSTRLEDVPVSIALDRAKIACDTLKNSYESGYKHFNRSMKDAVIRRQYILSHIDQAIEEKWIKVYYQPIVRAVTGRVCDEEALARWIDPVEGFLSPGEFIPLLEEAGLIYKLDLYVLEHVLSKIKAQKAAGLFLVPQSINLSRSDFQACDIVEEIRKRVDESGVPRSLITIELTESTIARDYNFMQEQIERFEKLGFAVWLDDFGSGYSSLDVLQSIKFDLLKLDMSFMRKMNESDKAKTVLRELVKMANALDIDTVCEGVETEEQVAFLREIGCSKLQGFYYQKPIPFEKILEKYHKGIQIGLENPEEASYYDSIGRTSLYDLTTVPYEDGKPFRNTFDTMPMGVMEVSDGKAQYIRSNQAYRDFMKRFFGFDLSDPDLPFEDKVSGLGASFIKHVRNVCKDGGISFFDEQMPNGSRVHTFIRQLGSNPVTGKFSVAVAVLSITDADEGTTYASIARALAADYYNIYYVDLETESFIEYSSPIGGEDLAMERHGEQFFEIARHDAINRVFKDDQKMFLSIFTKESIIRELDERGVFAIKYRLSENGLPINAFMKISRMMPDKNRIIIGISLVDTQSRRKNV